MVRKLSNIPKPSAMGIPLDKAELLALFLECIIYGIFLTFFIILIAISLVKDPMRITNQRFVLPVASVMMVFATTHLVLDFVRVVQAFVTGDPTKPPNPISYYGKISNPLHVAKTLLYGVQTLLGDAVLIWRCYIVNNRSIYVIIPTGAVLLVNVALTAVIIWTFSGAVPGASIFETGARFIESFFIITMSLNLCCTVAIVLKVWRSHKRVVSNGRSLFPVMAVIIESGAIYTASVMGLLISFLSGSNGQYPALDIITPLVGVVYCLIILQIHFHLKLSHSSSGTPSGGRSLPNWRRPAGTTTYELNSSVAVRITEHAETLTDRDSETKNSKRLDDQL